jgi:hypothetical protein
MPFMSVVTMSFGLKSDISVHILSRAVAAAPIHRLGVLLKEPRDTIGLSLDEGGDHCERRPEEANAIVRNDTALAITA